MGSPPQDRPAPPAPEGQAEEDRRFWAEQYTGKRPDPPHAPTWYNDIHRSLLDLMEPYLPAEGTVAELGCGSASLLAMLGLRRPKLALVAIDYEESALRLADAVARVYGVEMETRLGDVTDLDVPDESFDMVLSGGLLEHFRDPRPVLREMRRTLRPGGSFFATVVPRKLFSLHRPLHRWLGPRVERTKYGADQYVTWLRELGMVDVVGEYKGVYPPLFHHLPPRPRRFIERAFRPLDGTWLADRLGFFFVLLARNPRRSSPAAR